MSDDKSSWSQSLMRYLSILADPNAGLDLKYLEAISARLDEIEDRLNYIHASQEKFVSDINAVSTTTAMLIKAMLRLTLQTQVLYDRLGLDAHDETVSTADGERSGHNDEGSGNGMGGMLN